MAERGTSVIIVQFIQRWSVYNCGELAGFSEADAQSLINRGFAVLKPAAAPVQKKVDTSEQPESQQPNVAENPDSEKQEEAPNPEVSEKPSKPTSKNK